MTGVKADFGRGAPPLRGYPLLVAATTTNPDMVGAEHAARSARIDGLRALAATLVLTFHVWWIMSPAGIAGRIADGGDPAHLANAWILRFGTFGVALFYLLSGFLLYGPFVAARFEGTRQPPLVPYLIRRALRIVPAYWAALVVIGLFEPKLDVFSIHGIRSYFLFGQIYSFQDLRQGFPLPPMWTICVEVTFYLFLPVWAWIADGFWRLSRRPLYTEFVLLVLLALGSIEWKLHVVRHATVESAFQPKLIALPASLDLFAAGMALAVVAQAVKHLDWQQPRRLARASWPWWLMALAAMLLTAAIARPDPLIGTDWATGTMVAALLKIPIAVGLVFPLLFGGAQGGPIRRMLGSRPVAWVGLVSYGLYLWHSWVIDRLARIDVLHHASPVAWPAVWALCLLAALAFASASWYLIERRAMRMGRRNG